MKKILLLAFLAIVLVTCTKKYEGPVVYVYDSYKLIIDYYNTDTSVRFKSITWWHDDSVWKVETKQLLDTTSDQWWFMCATYEKPEGWLEHRYYLKNGKKIQKSAYPKQK